MSFLGTDVPGLPILKQYNHFIASATLHIHAKNGVKGRKRDKEEIDIGLKMSDSHEMWLHLDTPTTQTQSDRPPLLCVNVYRAIKMEYFSMETKLSMEFACGEGGSLKSLFFSRESKINRKIMEGALGDGVVIDFSIYKCHDFKEIYEFFKFMTRCAETKRVPPHSLMTMETRKECNQRDV